MEEASTRFVEELARSGVQGSVPSLAALLAPPLSGVGCEENVDGRGQGLLMIRSSVGAEGDAGSILPEAPVHFESMPFCQAPPLDHSAHRLAAESFRAIAGGFCAHLSNSFPWHAISSSKHGKNCHSH